MRRVSMEVREEQVAAISDRYAGSGRGEKTRILDEFVAVTGFHRKHAMRLLRGRGTARLIGPLPGLRVAEAVERSAGNIYMRQQHFPRGTFCQ